MDARISFPAGICQPKPSTLNLPFRQQAKSKSEKARTRVYETVLKSVHAARQEAAQNRRDEQRRATKERIMAEEDPEKARRLEVCLMDSPMLFLRHFFP